MLRTRYLIFLLIAALTLPACAPQVTGIPVIAETQTALPTLQLEAYYLRFTMVPLILLNMAMNPSSSKRYPTSTTVTHKFLPSLSKLEIRL